MSTGIDAGLSRNLSRVFFLGRMSDVLFMHCLGASASRLAGAVREIEMDLRIPLYLSDTSPLTRRESAAAGLIIAAAGLQGYSLCNSGAGRFSPLRLDVQLFVFGLESLAFQ